MPRLPLISLLLFLLGAGPAFAWSAPGHQYVGGVADALLTGNARAQVQSILGISLQTAATWPDCVRSVKHTSGGFIWQERVQAFITPCTAFLTPDGKARMEDYASRNWDNCVYEPPNHGCHESYHFADIAELHGQYDPRYVGANDHDVVCAIKAAVLVLQDQPAPAPFSIRDKAEALLMLAHFVGDLHQPLHVGAVYLTSDGTEVDPDAPGAADPAQTGTLGGNAIMDGRRNLHSDWDDIDPALGNAPNPQALDAARQVAPTPAAPADMAALWASDSVAAAHAAFRGLRFEPPGAHPGHVWVADFDDRDAYVQRMRDLQQQQLVKGGAHLAQLLNAIWP